MARPRDIKPLSAWGERVDAFRKAQEISWAELYRRVGIERSLGRKYVTGEAAPSDERIEQFAAALSVAPAALEFSRPPRRGSTAAELEEIRQGLADLRELVRAQQAVLQAVLDRLQ